MSNWNQTARAAALAIILGVLGGLSTRAQDATPANGCLSTTPGENATLARAYWEEAYNGHDPSRVEDFLAEEFARHNLARTHENEPGFDDDIQRVAENLDDFSDLQVTVDDVVADDTTVAIRMTWRGTQSDPIAPWNASVSGQPMTMTVVAFYGVECGKLAEQWIVFDYLSTFRQLGIITDDELATLGSAADVAPAVAGTPVPIATEEPAS